MVGAQPAGSRRPFTGRLRLTPILWRTRLARTNAVGYHPRPGDSMRIRGIVLLVVALAGCSRAYYRSNADAEVYPAIAEHVVSPAAAIGRTQLEVPPNSRLYDPTDPDHPPKPPDDPDAARWTAKPLDPKGWERDGVTNWIEYPGWMEQLQLDAEGKVKLDADRSVELALLHSREYQTTLEGLYRVALALTLKRFEFALHWFGRNRG